MEWNERELAWLNKRRNFIETHDFTDIRIELGGELGLDLHEKKHLMAGIALALGFKEKSHIFFNICMVKYLPDSM